MKVGIKILGGVLAIYILVFFAVKWGWTNTTGMVEQVALLPKMALLRPFLAQSEEWQTLAEAVGKDELVIKRVATETNLSPRLIVAMIIPEQLRLFHDQREIFKKVFLPLKILGNQTQFSWGVAGLKPETAEEIEKNLADENSLFYPGSQYAHLLDFTTTNRGAERFQRIANEKDHYYSYLYVALYLREIISQWQKAGFDISRKPEILATLFNIGFRHSQPKSAPEVGGAEINLGGEKYSFGRLAYEFYYSEELITVFPSSVE